MARKRCSEEIILRLVREIEAHLHGGMDVVSACRTALIPRVLSADVLFSVSLAKLIPTHLAKNRRAFPAPMISFLTHFEFPFWNDSLDILCFKGKFS